MPRKSRVDTTRSRLKPDQSLRQISPISNELAGQSSDDLRIDKVMELRKAIHAGSYDVDTRVNDLLGKLETNLSGLVQAETDPQPSSETAPANESNPLDDAQPLEDLDPLDNDDFQDEFESLDALNENDDFDDDDAFDDEDERY